MMSAAWQLKVMALTAVTLTLFSLTIVRLTYYAVNKREMEIIDKSEV